MCIVYTNLIVCLLYHIMITCEAKGNNMGFLDKIKKAFVGKKEEVKKELKEEISK